MPRPTVSVLYVGGSIGMIRNRKTGCIEPMHSLIEFHRFVPDVQREVKLEFTSIANVGSSEVTPDHWVELADHVRLQHDRVDGFVIIHGTNTMAYTAAALSFALQNLGKPVVLTGSLMPIDELGSDGPMNMTYAIRAALLDVAEVCIAMGTRVLRGSRAKKVQQSLFETFESPKFPVLAEFNPVPVLHPWRVVRRDRTLQCKPSFDPHVASVTLHPGMPDEVFRALLESKPSGIVLRAYGQGMLPERLFPWIRTVTEREIPLVITSQLVRGIIDLHHFRKQLTLEQLGVISGKDMTYEAAVVKLMWTLRQTKNVRRIRELMERNLTGEMME